MPKRTLRKLKVNTKKKVSRNEVDLKWGDEDIEDNESSDNESDTKEDSDSDDSENEDITAEQKRKK
jgi:hypothetical protein